MLLHAAFQALLFYQFICSVTAFGRSSDPVAQMPWIRCTALLASTSADNTSVGRRTLLGSALAVITVSSCASHAHAGAVGARITKAVTTSDLGIAVRRSVVQGAQVMDGVDGQWERFSDKYGLGQARSQRDGRPRPKTIPPPQPLDGALATGLVEASDKVFLQVSNIKESDLRKQVTLVSEKVLPSFQRSSDVQGLSAPIVSGEQFNFAAYCHYKAYLDLIIERNVDFGKFKREFDRQMGVQVLQLLGDNSSAAMERSDLQSKLFEAVTKMKSVSDKLVAKGIIAQIGISESDSETVKDWTRDLADLTFSVELDGDVTLGAQLLLQEQGYRLYPSFGKCAMQTILTAIMNGLQQVTVDEYYMDTDYNSDPDRFEVKQVLLNIQLESI